MWTDCEGCRNVEFMSDFNQYLFKTTAAERKLFAIFSKYGEPFLIYPL